MMSIPYEIKQGYIGHPGQLVTLRRVTVAEGKAKGTEIIEVKNSGRLGIGYPAGRGAGHRAMPVSRRQHELDEQERVRQPRRDHAL